MIPNLPKAKPSTPPTLARSCIYTSHPAPCTPPYKSMCIWLISFHYTTWWWPKFVAEMCSCAFFFFLRCYNFKEVLAFSTNSFHLDQFLMQSFQLDILMFATSLFTSSSHLCLGFPLVLVDMGVHSYTFFTMLSSGIRYTCPNRTNLCALMWFMIFSFPMSLFSFSFDLILHVPSFSLVGP